MTRRAPVYGLALALLASSAFVMGCGHGDGAERAALFHAEKVMYEARKDEYQARLTTQHPDSTRLLAIRAAYLRVRNAVPEHRAGAATPEARERAADVVRALGAAEAAGVRLALEAHRPDLALESAQSLEREASADSVTARQAAFMTVAAYQGLHRYDDAVTEMKKILKLYAPVVSAAGGEDPVLEIPQAIVSLRRSLGDDDAAARELRESLDYYRSLVERPQPPALEAQIRARILRTYLELDQGGRALEEANNLERLVVATPSLHAMLADVAFAKGKIRATMDKDPSDGIAILDRLATDFPSSPLAPRALLEAARQAEAKGLYADAKTRYEGVLQRFEDSPEVAPVALLRLGIVKEKMDDWAGAKATFESVPVRYPHSQAAAEAPTAVIQHYMRDNRKTVAEQYFPKALQIYRDLVERDSTGQMAPLFRTKMFQIYSAENDSAGLYAITNEMLRNDPKHPYTAQVLLEAARAAVRFGSPSRSAAYLRRFIQDYPRSPLLDQVRRELRAQGG